MARFFQYLVFAVPVILPSALVRFSLAGLPFSALELYIYAIFALWTLWLLAVCGLRAWARESVMPFFQWGSVPQWLLLFFLAGLATWIVVPSEVIFNTGIKEHLYETYETRRVWLGIMKGWMLPMLLYGLMLSRMIRSQADKALLLRSAVLGAIILALVSLMSRYVLGIPDTLDGRLGGLYVSANYLVFLVAPAFVWCLYYAIKEIAGAGRGVVWKHQTLKRWKDWHTWLVWGGLIILGVTLLLARSYASWLVLAAITVFLAFRWLRAKKLLAAIVLGACIAAGALMTEAGSEKLRGFFTVDSQSSTSTRVEVYAISYALLKQHWLVGIGPGQYESQYITNAHRILGKTPYEWVMLHPHNLYVSVWLSVGLVGLIAFLGMIAAAVYGAYKERSLVALLPLIYLLAHGVVDTPFWKLDSMLLFVLLVVCSATWYATTSEGNA